MGYGGTSALNNTEVKMQIYAKTDSGQPLLCTSGVKNDKNKENLPMNICTIICAV